MKFIEEVERTGKIPEFRAEQLLLEFVKYDATKPSSRIVRTTKGKKAIGVLTEIQRNHNHSWYKEVKLRSERNPSALAIFYRGNKITFKDMFVEVEKLANSFAAIGLKKGDEVPCCISNTPELLYTMLAANKLGLKLNLFGTGMDHDYLKTILNDTSKKLIIITDENYEKIKDVVNEQGFENKLVYSLADSLPKEPEKCDEYVKDLDHYYRYKNLVPLIKEVDNEVMGYQDFIKLGENYQGEIIDDNNLDTEFLITYTSGSTRRGYPKPLVHSNRSLIVSGTFNDLELSGSPRIPYQRGMCYIHTESNTNLVTCVSDNLMKLWSVACEPQYDKNTALDVIRLNSPSMIEMTTSHLIQMAKDYIKAEKNGKKYKFPNLIATFAVGEATSKGEEKLINMVLHKARAGNHVNIKGFKLYFAPLSVGGGDCEHGGIFYNVFNVIKASASYFKTKSKDNGMAPIVFGVVTALRKNENGEYVECDYNEKGIIVANSATNMVGYKNNKEKTLAKIIRDDKGRDWLSCDVYGFVDNAGNIHQKDRVGSEMTLEDGTTILPSTIADAVLADTKNVLSCTVSKVSNGTFDVPVINFELSPLRKKSRDFVLKSMNERIQTKFGSCLKDNYLFREFSDDNAFKLAGSGKRDVVALENMGFDNTFGPYRQIPVDEKIQSPEEVEKIRR